MKSLTTHFMSLNLQNFRLFEEQEFTFNPHFTVLIGQNATGKSTILDALRMALSSYVSGSGQLLSEEQISETDVRGKIVHHTGAPSTVERFYPSDVRGKMNIFGELCEFSFSRDGTPERRNPRDLYSLANKYRKMLQGNGDFILPIIAYYGVSRASRLNSTRSGASGEAGLSSRTSGYKDCLSSSLNPLNFAEWLKKITYISLQEGVVSDLMKATLDAIHACLPEVGNIEYRVKEDAVIVSFGDNTSLPFNNLSDGYRSVMALAADIAHRAAKLNPHLEGRVAKDTPGIVLIDELDLHLHPKWQRRIVGDLKRAFPLIQFITTTHSPFIIQALEPGEVLDLGRQKPIDEVFAKLSIEDVVEEIMGVPMPQRSKRYQDMYDAATEYFDLLNQTVSADEEEKSALEEKLNKLSEPFSDDVAYYAFLNSKRIAAGLNSSRKENS